jgi:hypothetical protein
VKALKAAERDELAIEHARNVGRLADVFERDELEKRRREMQAERSPLFPPPKRVLAGARGASMMLEVFPGMAGLFTTVVPDSHLLGCTARDGELWQLVRCTCGAGTVLGDRDSRVVGFRSPNVDSCSGDCGRAFLVGEKQVFVHRFAKENWDD